MGGSGEAPLVLISRNAELGDVSDFGGQTPPSTRRGHVCFSPLGLRFHKARLAVFTLGISASADILARGAKISLILGSPLSAEGAPLWRSDRLIHCAVSTILAFRAGVIKPSSFHGKEVGGGAHLVPLV